MIWHLLPVSRDRYESTKADLVRAQQRCEWLERLIVQMGFDALQSSLRKNGYAQIGEADEGIPQLKEPAPVWTSLDHNMFKIWMADHKNATGATDAEAKETWAEEYGQSPPSRVLI